MMEDFKLKEMMDSYNLYTRSVNSISIGQNYYAKCSMEEFTLSDNLSSQHMWHRLPGFTHKPLDLQLSADEFISHSTYDFLGKGPLGGSLKEPFNFLRSSSPVEAFVPHDLNLSLSIGQDVGKRSGFGKSWIGKKKKTTPSSLEIIDLEDPNLVFRDRNPHLGTPLAKSSVDNLPIHPRFTSDSGIESWYKNETSGMNMVRLQNSCCTVNHSVTPYPSWSNSSFLSPASNSTRKVNVNHCTEARDIPRQLDLNVDLTEKISFIDLDSDSDDQELCSTVKKDVNCCKFDSSSDSVCTDQHQSSSVKTMQSGIQCDLNISAASDETQNTESNTQQEPDADELVEKAAQSLMQISLQTQKTVQIEQEEEEQPQGSSDSYAALVLEAKESDADEYCVSSNAFLVDGLEKKESSYKLKRGTRMKDFQKDILPSLSILSRHEIREDINILEGVIRSREYKRMRARFGDASECSRSTRSSKRSRVRCSRR